MAEVTITLSDTPTGGVSIKTDFKPAIGSPCSNAQSAALDVIRRTRYDWGIKEPSATTQAPPSSIGREKGLQ